MNNFRKSVKTGLIAMVTSGILSIGAQAGESSSKGPAPFSEFDKDGSGYVSEDEFNTTRGQRMAAKAAEGKKMRGAASAPGFSGIDTNDDGEISEQEFATHQVEHHKQMGKGKNH